MGVGGKPLSAHSGAPGCSETYFPAQAGRGCTQGTGTHSSTGTGAGGTLQRERGHPPPPLSAGGQVSTSPHAQQIVSSENDLSMRQREPEVTLASTVAGFELWTSHVQVLYSVPCAAHRSSGCEVRGCASVRSTCGEQGSRLVSALLPSSMVGVGTCHHSSGAARLQLHLTPPYSCKRLCPPRPQPALSPPPVTVEVKGSGPGAWRHQDEPESPVPHREVVSRGAPGPPHLHLPSNLLATFTFPVTLLSVVQCPPGREHEVCARVLFWFFSFSLSLSPP